jgi:hypothetical protein
MPVIEGTAGADTLGGTSDADTINAGAGDDLLLVGADSTLGDVISGGPGDDLFRWRQSEGFPSITIDGGEGRDTLDFGGNQDGAYWRSRTILLEDGAETNTISGHVSGSMGLYQPPLDMDFLTASHIEVIVVSEMTVELDGFTTALEVHGRGSGSITTGSGDDLIVLNPYSSFSVDGSGGTDTLQLEGEASDYLLVQNDSGWIIYSEDRWPDTVLNVEQVNFTNGEAISFSEAVTEDFHAWSYLASYADLRAAFGSDVVSAFRHFGQYGEIENRDVTLFDAISYIASYDDLIAAFGTDADEGARHWLQHGMAEGRQITFDPLAYLASNPELIAQFGEDEEAAAEHYIETGHAQGLDDDDFDAAAYLAANPDLRAAYGNDLELATLHYVRYGYYEGRTWYGDDTDAAEQVVETTKSDWTEDALI